MPPCPDKMNRCVCIGYVGCIMLCAMVTPKYREQTAYFFSAADFAQSWTQRKRQKSDVKLVLDPLCDAEETKVMT